MKILNFTKITVLAGMLTLPFFAYAVTADLNPPVKVQTTVASSTSSQVGTSTSSIRNNTTVDNTLVAGLEVNTAGVQVKNSNQVSSEEDLKVYSKNVILQNKNVSSVKTDSVEKVEVKYKHAGKFLGIFPVRVTFTTYIDGTKENKVWTRMPWWNMFVSGTHSVSTSLDTSLKNSTTVTASAEANASAAARAKAVEAIISAYANLESTATVSTQ